MSAYRLRNCHEHALRTYYQFTRGTGAAILAPIVIIKALAIAAVLALVPAKASAIPIGSSTIPSGGLEWLYPNWSLNISYAGMINQILTPGSPFFGLRFATTEEVVGLADNFDIVTFSYTYHTTVPEVIDLLGIAEASAYAALTFEQEMQTAAESATSYKSYPLFVGFVAEDLSQSETFGISLEQVGGSSIENIPSGSTVATLFAADKDFADQGIGSWLVVSSISPVPEPGSLVLFGLGLAGLAASRRSQLN